MLMVAQLLLLVFAAYTLLGIAFACAFILRGAKAIDHAAADAGLGFKLIIFPASAALWPLLLTKWRRSARAGKTVP